MTTVYVKVTGNASDPQDEEIPGRYRLDLDEDVPFEHRANAALDVFHGDVAVDVLDDFTFVVIDEDGTEVDQVDGVEDYFYVDHGTVSALPEAEDAPSPEIG